MADLATLKISVDTRDITRAKAELDSLSRSSEKTADSTNKVSSAFSNLKAILAAAGIAAVAREYINLADTYTQINSKLRLVTENTRQLSQVQDQLFSMSQKTRVGFEGTVDLYARIARSTQSMGVSQEQLLKVTDTINKSLIVSGTSAEQASGALMQLGQGFASGALRGDELNSVLEGTPRLAQAIADGMGVTVGQLREMGKQGKITSDVLMNALLKAGMSVNAEFEKMTPTVGQAMTVMGNATLKAAGEFDKANGISKALANSLMVLANNMGTVISVAVEAGRVIASATLGFLAFRAAIIIGPIIAYIGAIVSLAVECGVLATANMALAGSFAAVKVAMGPIAIALTVAAAAYLYFRDTTSAADETVKSMTETIKAHNLVLSDPTATDAAINQSRRLVNQRIAEAKAALIAANAELKRLQALSKGSPLGVGGWIASVTGLDKAFGDPVAKKINKVNGEISSLKGGIFDLTMAGMGFGDTWFNQFDKVASKAIPKVSSAVKQAKKDTVKTFGELLAEMQIEVNTALIKSGQGVGETITEALMGDPGKAVTEMANAFVKIRQDGIDAAQAIREKFMEATVSIDLESVFGNVGKAFGGILNGMDQLIEKTQEYNDALATMAPDDARRGALQDKNLRNQVALYGNLIASAKGFFKQGSSGYKAMEAAETAFRMVSLALAIKDAAVKIGLIGGVTAATTAAAATDVATTAAAETAKTGISIGGALARIPMKLAEGAASMFAALGPLGFAAVAAMVGVMAAFGFSGGGSSQKPKYNSGKGTVLGDPTAQSESITKSIEHLDKVSEQNLRYSSQMTASLKNIEKNIAGLSNLIVRTTGIQASGANVNVGTAVEGPMKLIGGLGSKIPVIGGVIGSITKALFGTKTTIFGQGITGAAQSISDILATGFDAMYFTDIKKKKKLFGITSSTKYSTQLTEADAEIARQFTMIFSNIYDAVVSASAPLGMSFDEVTSKLESYIVDIGKIDVKGLTGAEIQEKLTAVFGAAADNIAMAAIPGLEQFQQVGEGYFETVVRVSSTVESLAYSLNSLGNAMVLNIEQSMALVDAFGGINDMQSQMAEYFDKFYTEEEQTATLTRQLTETLRAMGLSLPSTIADFRALVEAQDLTTEAGRNAYAALIKLSPSFYELVQQTDKAKEAADKYKEALKSAGDAVIDEIKRLRGIDGAASLADVQAQFGLATAAARLGDVKALEQLPKLSQAVEEAATNIAASQSDVARTRAWLDASLTETLRMLNIPAFANGGMHTGGLRIVGENGPELQATGPARIYDANQTASILSGGNTADQVSSLRAEMQNALFAIAKNTGKSSDLMSRWDGDGIPDFRNYASNTY